MAATPTPVLHVAHALGLGGTEKVMQLLVTHLDRERYDPTVFSFRDGPRGRQLRDAGIRTHVGGDLLRVLERVEPRIVHVHRAGWPEPDLLRPLKLYLRRRPHARVVETNVFGRFDPTATPRDIHRHLFVSHFCLARYAALNDVDVSGPRHQVLHNPVDTDLFARLCPERPAQDPGPGPVVGRLSRPDPGKWSNLALAVIPLLARAVPGFRYRVVGGTPQAREFVREMRLEEYVEFLDPLHTDRDLAAFFNSVSLLAHANDTGESFGLAIAEAMAAGLPVVTHPCPWPKDNAQLELVEHGVNGLVAREAREYAQAVAGLLADPQRAREMGRQGRLRANTFFRAQDQARRLEAVYRELLEETGP